MLRKISATLLVTLLALSLQAQEKERKARRPDLPGSFLIEFGFNRAQGTTPTKFDPGLWGSRTLNLYYQYPIRLWKTKFSYNPGGGFSFERYKLSNNYTLARQASGDGSFPLVQASDLNMPNADKSMLIMNYFELMPVELRFDTKPDDLARSIHISAGVRVGYLFESHTKVNYSEGGDSKTIKDNQNHGLSSLRYGVYSRLGVGSFNFFGYYNITPIFQANKGPELTQMNTLTVGISLSGF
ncbi:MAG: outer membrane beta-barrel protein [Cyclobacteriaceae bacterium]